MTTMAKMDANQNRYYPSRTKVGNLHDDFRKLFDHVYALQDRLDASQSRVAELEKSHNSMAATVAQGPSNTKIGGFNVRGTPPANGQTLKYNAATGDISWQ